MSKTLIVVSAIFAVFAITGTIGCGIAVSARTQCIAAEAGIKAQYQDNQNVYDNVWKSIKEVAQVTDKFVEANRDLLKEAVEGRKGATGEMVRMIKESNPTLDPQVFLKVQQVIESGRKTFSAGQTALLDRKREYEGLYQSPSVLFANLFIQPFPRIRLDDFKIVTSEETEAAFSAGKAPIVDVFGKR